MSQDAFVQRLHRRLPRMLAAGVDYNDAMTIASQATGLTDWTRLWTQMAGAHETLGDAAARAGNSVSAGEAYARAAVYLHVAQSATFHDRDEKDQLQQRQQQVAGKGLRFLRPPASIVEVPFEDFAFPARVRIPFGDGPEPCVILNAGADSTKEEFYTLESEFLKRGLATCSYDGPGQSQTWHKQKLRPDFEKPVGAVLDMLVRHARIDPERIGIWGRSLGGYAAPRAAAFDDRIKACVSAGAIFDFDDAWDRAPQALHEAMMGALGIADPKDARERIKDFSLKGISQKPKCPLLIVHSTADETAPVADAERMRAWAGRNAEVVIFPEGNHVCDNIPYKVRPLMADWLSRRLDADMVS